MKTFDQAIARWIIGPNHVKQLDAIQSTPAGDSPAYSDALKRAHNLCLHKTRRNIERLADAPRSAAWAVDGNYFAFPEGFNEIGNWTSSFFTGMALLAWRVTADTYFLHQVRRLEPAYRDKVFIHHADTMHDLGFLYSLYSVALHKLTGEKEHREVGLRAAELLANRFVSKGRFIRAWGRMDDPDPRTADMAIIDCMMNLPLLYWASQETGDSRFRNIAGQHADTTSKYFIRNDDSTYHAYRFDLETGQPRCGETYGGWAVSSHWTRGAAWAIYGFALNHRYTRNPNHLDASLRVARRFIACLDGEGVPLWDFKLRPGAAPIRDASAASIAACGLQELLKYHPGDAELTHALRRLLARLCSNDYLDFDDSVPGVQKNGQVGDGQGMARNAYTSWGDYFLMEALNRELGLGESFW